MTKPTANRRQIVQSMLAAALAGAYANGGIPIGLLRGRAEAATPKDPRYLFVFTLGGAASIFDSFLAQRYSEVKALQGNPEILNCFDDSTNATTQFVVPKGKSPFRAVNFKDLKIGTLGNLAVNTAPMGEFLQEFYEDLVVMPWLSTSVNHGVGQNRSVTGNDAWKGRTLMEVAAMTHGEGMSLANLALALGGFTRPGIDESIPEFAKPLRVADSTYFALGLSASVGLDGAPTKEALDLARQFRNTRLEAGSEFFKTFSENPALKRWLDQRNRILAAYEGEDLIKRLAFLESPGLRPSDSAIDLREAFPNFKADPLDAQCILAMLAVTSGSTSSVCFGMDQVGRIQAKEDGSSEIINPPIGFDFSHNEHRGIQALQWNRAMAAASKLMRYLKATDHPKGGKYWDRSVFYFATDFGRDRVRPSGATTFATGHHVENAAVIVSPLAKGNTVFGGVKLRSDKNDFALYGFDRSTGEADQNQPIATEKELYTSVLTLLGVDTAAMPGAPNMSFVRKS